IHYKNNNGNIQEINPKQVELVCGKDSSKFKVGDKVRLNTDKETEDYFWITGTMIDNYDVLTISSIDNNGYGGETEINVRENEYSYHPSWLELVEDDREEMTADVEEEIGYTTITAVHFGNYGEYTWQCDRDLFKDIKLLDLVLVDTVKGEQVVQVIKKSETIDIEGIHKKVIKKLEVY
ncbi:MAG TPA: hypothetical protein VFC79_02490, partial [Tissierellaceae bacterium]|nr:hypothetical protein [Tissierellaceae bacterium]